MVLKSFKVDKLIRDFLPEILRKKGIIVHERILEQEEYIASLKKKLLEEVEEAKQAGNLEELSEELGDILEVIHALAKAAGIPWQHIEDMKKKKREIKGGFDRKIYNLSIDIEDDHPNLEYYKNKAHLYPEMENNFPN